MSPTCLSDCHVVPPRNDKWEKKITKMITVGVKYTDKYHPVLSRKLEALRKQENRSLNYTDKYPPVLSRKLEA
jgi:CRISPR/Cas system-associated protein Cas5 (RAMP superfamily)